MILELKQKRAKLIADARQILDKAQAEGRSNLNSEEQANWDKFMADADEAGKQAKTLERQERAEAELNQPEQRSSGAPPRGAENRNGRTRDAAEIRRQYREWMRSGHVGEALRADQRASSADLQNLLMGLAERGHPTDLLEMRSHTVGSSTQSGYMVQPVEIAEEIFRLMDDETFILQNATVKQVNAAVALGIRKTTARQSDFDWTTEVASVTEDTDFAGARRDLTPKLSSKLAKISIALTLISSEPEKEVNSELAYKQALTLEKACLVGNGSGKPLGLFYASSSGISTGRDFQVATDASGGTFSGDQLIALKYKVRKPYRRDKSCGFISHRDVISKLRQLKDGENRYLWKAGLAKDDDDTFLSHPIFESEFTPNSMAAGSYPILFGAMKYFVVARYKNVPVQRLDEKYADTNEIGFIGRMWADGGAIQEEAFARGKTVAA